MIFDTLALTDPCPQETIGVVAATALYSEVCGNLNAQSFVLLATGSTN